MASICALMYSIENYCRVVTTELLELLADYCSKLLS